MARKQQSFEASLERLTEIVSLLERDDTPLADAMKLYEEGIGLARVCRTELDAAELRITELRARTGAEPDTEPVEDDDDR